MLTIYLQMIDSQDEKDKFEELYYKYNKLMFYVAKKTLNRDEDAADAVNDAFLLIAKNFRKIGIIDSKETRNFVAVIARNAAIDIYRKRRNSEALIDPVIPQNNDSLDINDFDIVDYHLVLEAVQELSEHYRDVVYLYYVEGYRTTEIANMLHLQVDNVRKRLQRGREILIAALGDE
ncbi:RNA polymerase sigma factor [Aminicella lysinilytica]|jgi:RNA polymerase sigma-70 factor (ECF subfamily)|uniref:RNA polymerase sigma-70 factor (ECF subfamily) n=1 Tax=Aminicella lysinilytica TaxID=433323 RepID=A0A4R6QCB9_9FIRM|nr:sigma-70 family RNA polymerase sigma factor [Aminicella lysinilytica]NLD10538.1 sigma-70 family RNA polymerase sigma factor [Clostridiales bacterium]TDP58999.1 RNA polymerase sigma-70 factor (ECF subfamily) [Aminicella lysinilytica]